MRDGESSGVRTRCSGDCGARPRGSSDASPPPLTLNGLGHVSPRPSPPSGQAACASAARCLNTCRNLAAASSAMAGSGADTGRIRVGGVNVAAGLGRGGLPDGDGWYWGAEPGRADGTGVTTAVAPGREARPARSLRRGDNTVHVRERLGEDEEVGAGGVRMRMVRGASPPAATVTHARPASLSASSHSVEHAPQPTNTPEAAAARGRADRAVAARFLCCCRRLERRRGRRAP